MPPAVAEAAARGNRVSLSKLTVELEQEFGERLCVMIWHGLGGGSGGLRGGISAGVHRGRIVDGEEARRDQTKIIYR